MRYFTATNTQLPKAVVDAAFTLKKTGKVVGPIDGGDGNFYILKQTGHRKAIDKSFEDVKRQIRNRLYREKRTQAQKDFVADLKIKANIKTFEEALLKVQIDTSSPATDGHGHGAKPGQSSGHGAKEHSHAPDTASKSPEATP